MADNGQLPHPSATPRIATRGQEKREKPLVWIHGPDDRWEIKVTPIGGHAAAGEGKPFAGSSDTESRWTFEVRVRFWSKPSPAFDVTRGEGKGRPKHERAVELWNTRDRELAEAVAKVVERMLHQGADWLYLPSIAEDVRRHRS